MAIPSGQIIDNKAEVKKKIDETKGRAYLLMESNCLIMRQYNFDGKPKCVISQVNAPYSRLSGADITFDSNGGRYCAVDNGISLYIISDNGKIKCNGFMNNIGVSNNIEPVKNIINDNNRWTRTSIYPTSDINWEFNDYNRASRVRNTFNNELMNVNVAHNYRIGENQEIGIGVPNESAYHFKLAETDRDVQGIPKNFWSNKITSENFIRNDGYYGSSIFKYDYSALNPKNFGLRMNWTDIFAVPSESNGFSYYKSLFYDYTPTYYNGYAQLAPLVDRQMSSTSDNPSFAPTKYNFLGVNILVCNGANAHSDALKYLDDGTIPDDSYIYALGDMELTQSTKKEDSGDDETNNEDGTKNNNMDETPYNENTENVLGNLNSRYYICNKEEVNKIVSSLWNGLNWEQSFFNNFTGLYSNLSELVIKLHWLPIKKDNDEFGFLGSITTRIGAFDLLSDKKNENSTFTTPYLQNYPSKKDGMWTKPQRIASFDIKEKYNSYLDFAPWTNMFVFLPFVGFVSIDTNMFMEENKINKMNIDVRTDVITGDITYFIKKDKTIVQIEKGNCLVNIPISVKQERSIEQTISDSYSNAVMGNATSIPTALKTSAATKKTQISKEFGSSIGGTLANVSEDFVNGLDFQQPQPIVKGSASATSQLFLMSYVALYTTRPVYNRAKDYEKKFGYPSNHQCKLSEAIGYNEVNAPQIRKWSKPMTNEEIDEIYSILSDGFIVRSE